MNHEHNNRKSTDEMIAKIPARVLVEMLKAAQMPNGTIVGLKAFFEQKGVMPDEAIPQVLMFAGLIMELFGMDHHDEEHLNWICAGAAMVTLGMAHKDEIVEAEQPELRASPVERDKAEEFADNLMAMLLKNSKGAGGELPN